MLDALAVGHTNEAAPTPEHTSKYIEPFQRRHQAREKDQEERFIRDRQAHAPQERKGVDGLSL